MERTYKFNLRKNAGLYVTYGLVFFLCAFAGCKHRTALADISVVWKGERAVGIRIPKGMIKDYSLLRAKHSVKIMLADNKGSDSILGDFKENGDAVVFEPLIPLSQRMTYNVLQDGNLLGTIKFTSSSKAPQVLAIYPEKDTVPENLLKIYLHFSKPMRTGNALDHIFLLDKNKDTMRNVFLNLQPELWDTSGTVLTVWLDPGRIKRGLVLNHKLGNPLKKDGAYQLVVSKDWKDSRGVKLDKNYTKNFVAGRRDEVLPDISKWKLTIPKAGTSEPLIINTLKPFDHYLLQESVGIIDGCRMIYSANTIGDKDGVLKIVPIAPWKAQAYKIRVLARLEDLAGNNLNRVFDRDITKDKQTNKEYFERGFVIVQ